MQTSSNIETYCKNTHVLEELYITTGFEYLSNECTLLLEAEFNYSS